MAIGLRAGRYERPGPVSVIDREETPKLAAGPEIPTKSWRFTPISDEPWQGDNGMSLLPLAHRRRPRSRAGRS